MREDLELKVDSHLVLKPLLEKDFVTIKKWKNDRDLSILMLSKFQHTDLQDVRQWYVKNMGDNNQILLGIYLVGTNKLIGVARVMFINWDAKEAELGIYIGNRSDRGKEYGSKAFARIIRYLFMEQDFNRLFLKVSRTNRFAMKSYLKLGFKEEDELENNVVLMAIYKREIA